MFRTSVIVNMLTQSLITIFFWMVGRGEQQISRGELGRVCFFEELKVDQKFRGYQILGGAKRILGIIRRGREGQDGNAT